MIMYGSVSFRSPNQNLMKHELKTLEKFFQPTWAGVKDFEIRNNDRKFSVHDEIVLMEIDQDGEETGRYVQGFIQYITTFEQKPDYVVFGYREILRGE